MTKLSSIVITILTFIGMPLFAVMGGISLLAWISHEREDARSFMHIAANVLADTFLTSPILVTVPLFTFAGYLMAESKTPDRLVRAASAALGWMPGGLAVVCIFANAFFTTMTGGSGVTIVAIGGLLYPALLKQGYPQRYALGLVTAAGAVGLLFFPSPLVMIYAFIAGVDIDRAYLALLVPGLVLMAVLVGHAVLVGLRSKVPRARFDGPETLRAMWDAKWEIIAPVLVLGGMGTGTMGIDEAAAAAATYILVVEVYVYKDLTWKDVVRIAREAISLSGAILMILFMATALTNYVVDAQIPLHILEWFTNNGMDKTWEFLIVLNIFLFILGVVMDEFSAMLVALPLIVPLAAKFGVSPFHLAVMVLLNIEIAYISPPIGINLYIASFRFNKPISMVYSVVMPFVWILTASTVLFVFAPVLSTFTLTDDIAEARAQAEKDGSSPRDAWLLECVQTDPNHPRPCTDADREKYGELGDGHHQPVPGEGAGGGAPAGEEKPPVELSADEAAKAEKEKADLLAEMLGETPKKDDKADAGVDAGAGGGAAGTSSSTTSGGE
ncbi:MAG: TRAP transporter large permease [Myxococcales bacterium]|nr:TRAP transporter large permease [Myxococcales bacterium]